MTNPPKLDRAARTFCATIIFAAAMSLAAQCQSVAEIYGLPGYNFGAGDLVADTAGNLYGTTVMGGSSSTCKNGCGTVFELSPTASGWSATTLYNFTGIIDGSNPTTGVVFDAKGNLYGATATTIYELSPASGGTWTETTLYTFTGKADGAGPTGPLALDAAGNVYGTAEYGGSSACSSGCGVAFKLSPNADGTWTYTVIHTFTGGADGAQPIGGVLLLNGNLYGAAGGGNPTQCTGAGCGIIFQLSSNAQGWQEFVVHAFTGGSDGANPFGALVADSAGNLYGTTTGLAFEFSKSSGHWQEKVLHRFKADGVGFPQGGLVRDAAGNLYGESGSAYCNSFVSYCGVAYELSKSTTGWRATAYYRFGNNPAGSPFVNSAGDIFGVSNGPSETGVSGVFEITP